MERYIRLNWDFPTSKSCAPFARGDWNAATVPAPDKNIHGVQVGAKVNFHFRVSLVLGISANQCAPLNLVILPICSSRRDLKQVYFRLIHAIQIWGQRSETSQSWTNRNHKWIKHKLITNFSYKLLKVNMFTSFQLSRSASGSAAAVHCSRRLLASAQAQLPIYDLFSRWLRWWTACCWRF